MRVCGAGLVASVAFASSRALAVGGVAAVLMTLAPPFVGRAFAQSPPAAPETFAIGDWQLAPTAQVRTRAEVRRDPVDLGGSAFGEVGTPRVRNSIAVLERSRLGLGGERGALRVQLTLQDARAWGSPSPTAVPGDAVTPGAGLFGVYEAFVELRTSAARPSFLRLGRQAVSWGDGRLLGNADWSQAPRTLDALRGHLALGAWDFDAFAALLETPHPLGVGEGDTAGGTVTGTELYGAQASVTIDPWVKIELTGLARIARSGGVAPEPWDGTRFGSARALGETYVGSLRVAGDARGLRYAIEGAGELGRALTLEDHAVAAYAAAAYLEKKLDTIALAPTARVSMDYASGDNGGGHAYRQFDPILPDVHTLHGAMDIFAFSNLAEVSGRVAIAPHTDMALGVEYRYAQLAEARGEWLGGYLDGIGRGAATGNASSVLGHEVDAFASWNPWVPLHLGAGYSLFVLGDGARAILASAGRGASSPEGIVTPSRLSHFGYLHIQVDIP